MDPSILRVAELQKIDAEKYYCPQKEILA
jgi:hypothetical protein